VLITAAKLKVAARPHTFACGHLANTASLLLPISNLTNLLAFAASGLSFLAFAGHMALPWVVAIGIEYLIFRWFFRSDLNDSAGPPRPPAGRTPIFALVVLAATLAGFVILEPVGVAPGWVALAGSIALASANLRGPGERSGVGVLGR